MDILGSPDNLPEDLKEMHEKLSKGISDVDIRNLLSTMEKTLNILNGQIGEPDEP